METAREFNDQWRSMDIWYPHSLVFGSYILLIRVAPLDCHSIINLCHGTVAIYILLAGCIDRTDLSRSKSANNSKIALDLDLHGSTILHLALSTGNTAKLLSLAFQKWHCQSRIKAKSVSDQRLIFEVTGPQRESFMTCGALDRKSYLDHLGFVWRILFRSVAPSNTQHQKEKMEKNKKMYYLGDGFNPVEGPSSTPRQGWNNYAQPSSDTLMSW